jgi:hypothetical protein
MDEVVKLKANKYQEYTKDITHIILIKLDLLRLLNSTVSRKSHKTWLYAYLQEKRVLMSPADCALLASPRHWCFTQSKLTGEI